MCNTKKHPLRDTAITAALLFAATVLGVLFRILSIHETNIVVVYLLSVLFVARYTKGYLYGISAAVLSILLYNCFFTEPYFTLKVNDPTYLITFAIMAITACTTSALTSKVKKAATDAMEKESESNALYQMTNQLTDAENQEAIAGIIIRTVGEVLSRQTAFVLFDDNGTPEKTFLQQAADGSILHRELENGEELQRRMQRLNASYDIGEEFCDFPIYGRSGIMGVLRIPKQTEINESQNRMLHAILESSSLALERFRSLQAQTKIREEAMQERYRGNLLRAISHDLRTPLSGIMGASEMLMDMTKQDDSCYALAKGIYKDADWLHGLVENILNLTKIQEGRLVIDKQPEAIEEVIGAAIMVVEKRIPGRDICVQIPDDVLIVPMDARLISQVLVNLLDNAAKHTQTNQQIGIRVHVDKTANMAVISVWDEGSGIAPQDLPKIFQMFYTTRSKSPDATRGVGLGLTICQSIVEAHGGSISARNREGGGSEFTFTLPLGGEKS